MLLGNKTLSTGLLSSFKGNPFPPYLTQINTDTRTDSDRTLFIFITIGQTYVELSLSLDCIILSSSGSHTMAANSMLLRT